jgi:hypothetical protein
LESRINRAALGFRVKSGWASAVLLAGSVDSPRLCDNRLIDLCDPKIPATRQPFHAAMGRLEEDAAKVEPRLRVVHRVTGKSVESLLADYCRNGYAIRHAALVVGSQIDPVSVANPHIRAHALEGQLFRTELEQALHANRIGTLVLKERDAYAQAASQLRKSILQVRQTIQNFGRSTKGAWRTEQKLAALAAWISLCLPNHSRKRVVGQALPGAP